MKVGQVGPEIKGVKLNISDLGGLKQGLGWRGLRLESCGAGEDYSSIEWASVNVERLEMWGELGCLALQMGLAALVH